MSVPAAALGATRATAASTPSTRAGAVVQYVCFTLGAEYYGAEIQRVQEIKGWDSVTRVPYTPTYLLGVLNLRGSIVPVIDLRLRFGLEHVPYDASTVIVVVRVRGTRGERTAGLVVDAVSDVHDVTVDEVRPAPEIPGGGDRSSLRGIAHCQGRLVLLLDIERLVGDAIEPQDG